MGLLLLRMSWLLPLVGIAVALHYATSEKLSLDRYERIIVKIRRKNLEPGVDWQFRMSDVDEPRTIRPAELEEDDQISDGGARIWARRSSSGNLTVVIADRDHGRAGEFGVAYAEAPLPAVADPETSSSVPLEVLDRLNRSKLKWKIDEHWWRLENPVH